MRKELRRKFEALEAEENRLSRLALLVGLIGILVVAAIWAVSPLSVRNVPAVVRFAYSDNRDNPRRDSFEIEAETESGQIVRAESRPLRPPAQGERILLRERRFWYGRHYYSWEGLRP